MLTNTQFCNKAALHSENTCPGVTSLALFFSVVEKMLTNERCVGLSSIAGRYWKRLICAMGTFISVREIKVSVVFSLDKIRRISFRPEH